MKVLVCGGRHFKDDDAVRGALDFYDRKLAITKIIHGGASGADWLAGRWASERKVECDIYRAEWDKYGKRAGPIRNAKMLADGKPDMVLAFKGGRGTRDMVRRAIATVKLVCVGWDFTDACLEQDGAD